MHEQSVERRMVQREEIHNSSHGAQHVLKRWFPPKDLIEIYLPNDRKAELFQPQVKPQHSTHTHTHTLQ